MAEQDGGPAKVSAQTPEKKQGRTKAPQPQPQMTFVVRVLLEWAGETHGKLLLMGLSLGFIGGVLTLGSWLTRDEKTGEFHVWFAFFFVGVASFASGVVAWIWKVLKNNRKAK